MKIISPSSSLSLLLSIITNCLCMVAGEIDLARFWPVLGVVAVLSGVDVEVVVDVVAVGGDGVIVVVVGGGVVGGGVIVVSVVVVVVGGDVVGAAVELAVDVGAVGADGDDTADGAIESTTTFDDVDDVDGVVVVVVVVDDVADAAAVGAGGEESTIDGVVAAEVSIVDGTGASFGGVDEDVAVVVDGSLYAGLLGQDFEMANMR